MASTFKIQRFEALEALEDNTYPSYSCTRVLRGDLKAVVISHDRACLGKLRVVSKYSLSVSTKNKQEAVYSLNSGR